MTDAMDKRTRIFTALDSADLDAVRALAQSIAGAVDAVLHRDADIDETIAALLARPLRPEY